MTGHKPENEHDQEHDWDNDPLMLDHDYDGIRELDNPLPRWWLIAFFISILFSPLYIFYYHVGPGLSLDARYRAQVEAIESQRAASRGQGSDGSAYVAASEDPERVESGQAVYATNCAACHGAQGEGLIGPNLTDGYWMHGGSPQEIATAIRYGIPEKGMPGWDHLSPVAIEDVTGFILSIQGSEPENARPPEGEKYEGEPDTLAAAIDDPDVVATGASVYGRHCASCHGVDGEGLIGPSLIDDEWTHGGSPREIAASIRDGIPEKGMPPWDNMLRQDEISAVTGFIVSLGKEK